MFGNVIKDKMKFNNSDKIISIALMSSFVVLILQYFILIIFDLKGTALVSFIQIGSKVIVGIIFAIAFPFALRRKIKLFIFIYGIVILIFGYNYFMFPENHYYLINVIFPFFFMSIPSFLYVLSIKDLTIFNIVTHKIAYIIFVLGSIIGVMVFLGATTVGIYSMTFSYYMLLPTLVFIGKLFDKFSITTFLLASVSIIVILALGSRGALICITIFVLLRMFSPKQKLSLRKIYLYGIVCFTALIAFISFERILVHLNNIFFQYGIQSRTITLLLQEEIQLSGRNVIVDNVISNIMQSPLTGIGLLGDTRIIGHSYVHNFFIEILGNFGIPFGMIIIITLLSLIFISLFFSNNYNMIVLWLSLGFIHLLVSSSYLIDLKFWIFLGVVFHSISNYKNDKFRNII